MIKTVSILCLALTLTAPVARADVTSPSASLDEKKSDQGEISYPVFWNPKNPAIEKSVNDAIQKEVAGWSCEENGDGISFDAISEVRYLNDKILSYTTNFDYYCGGAYPDVHMETRNYDLSSGKLITPDDILTEDLAGEKLATFLLKKHIHEVEECEDAYEDRTWNFYLTENDIVFIPEMPHVAQVCAVEFKIPRKQIEPHLKSGTALER